MVEMLARGVAHAHEQGIIHRDLKPANVLLSRGQRPGARGQVRGECEYPYLAPLFPTPKFTDFGLAKRLERGSGMTQSGTIMGTPFHMAPEQAAGSRTAIGPCSDIYSLGAIHYEMLTGRPPFRAVTAAETLMEAIGSEPVAVHQRQARTPRDLETICHKSLNKDPARRYETALALAEDLCRFQAGEPIHARPIGRLERGWRWCKRNPDVAGSLVIALAALLLGSAACVLFGLETRRAARRADDNAAQDL